MCEGGAVEGLRGLVKEVGREACLGVGVNAS